MWSEANQVRIRFGGDNAASLVDVEWLVQIMDDSIPVCVECCETAEQSGVELHGETIGRLPDPLLADDIKEVEDSELPPGSDEKLVEFARRVLAGQSLFQTGGSHGRGREL